MAELKLSVRIIVSLFILEGFIVLVSSNSYIRRRSSATTPSDILPATTFRPIRYSSWFRSLKQWNEPIVNDFRGDNRVWRTTYVRPGPSENNNIRLLEIVLPKKETVLPRIQGEIFSKFQATNDLIGSESSDSFSTVLRTVGIPELVAVTVQSPNELQATPTAPPEVSIPILEKPAYHQIQNSVPEVKSESDFAAPTLEVQELAKQMVDLFEIQTADAEPPRLQIAHPPIIQMSDQPKIQVFDPSQIQIVDPPQIHMTDPPIIKLTDQIQTQMIQMLHPPQTQMDAAMLAPSTTPTPPSRPDPTKIVSAVRTATKTTTEKDFDPDEYGDNFAVDDLLSLFGPEKDVSGSKDQKKGKDPSLNFQSILQEAFLLSSLLSLNPTMPPSNKFKNDVKAVNKPKTTTTTTTTPNPIMMEILRDMNAISRIPEYARIPTSEKPKTWEGFSQEKNNVEYVLPKPSNGFSQVAPPTARTRTTVSPASSFDLLAQLLDQGSNIEQTIRQPLSSSPPQSDMGQQNVLSRPQESPHTQRPLFSSIEDYIPGLSRPVPNTVHPLNSFPGPQRRNGFYYMVDKNLFLGESSRLRLGPYSGLRARLGENEQFYRIQK